LKKENERLRDQQRFRIKEIEAGNERTVTFRLGVDPTSIWIVLGILVFLASVYK
jgi:hypothetical protein